MQEDAETLLPYTGQLGKGELCSMETKVALSRRGWIRIISYTVALIVALTAGTISGYTLANQHRTTIEYSYQRALGELTEYLGNLDITLEKGKYANTSTQLQGLSTKLWKDAGYAKGLLGQLPVDGSELANTYKYLSQVGDFCMVLSKRVSEGGTITEEERASLKQLTNYSHEILDRVAQLQSDAAAGILTFDQAGKDTALADAPSINSGFHEMEEGFEDYPTLIYDGPFSDHIQQQEPKYLKGKTTVSQDEAAQKASSWFGAQVTATDEIAGNLPCYQFYADNYRIALTKQGGYVRYFMDSRTIGEAGLSVDEALQKGADFLNSQNIGTFTQRYYSLNKGVLTINFAYTKDQVIYYPDLIKVGIAMDDGEVVSFDASGFLMNHTDRTLPTPTLSAEKAQENLNPLLKVTGTPRFSLIPTEGLSEKLCYEFTCTGEDDEQVLVYIDVQAGQEEQILILLKDETGVLVM